MRYRRFHDRPGCRARAHRARSTAARGHRGARHRRDRIRLPRPRRHRRGAQGVAAPTRVRGARRRAGERRRGDLPRARVHEGRAVGQRQQPPGPVRTQRRRPQRPSRQRRCALPAARRPALDAAHHGRLRGHRDAGRPLRRYRGGAHRGARERSRGSALGWRARTADARAPRVAAALPGPWRRLRALRLDRGAARARSAGDGPGRADRGDRRGPRTGTARGLRASRAAASAVDRRYVGQALVTYPPLAEKPALLRLALAAF